MFQVVELIGEYRSLKEAQERLSQFEHIEADYFIQESIKPIESQDTNPKTAL